MKVVSLYFWVTSRITKNLTHVQQLKKLWIGKICRDISLSVSVH